MDQACYKKVDPPSGDEPVVQDLTLQCLDGSSLNIGVTACDTIDDLRRKVASVRGLYFKQVMLTAGETVPLGSELALSIGVNLSVSIKDTLGLCWSSLSTPFPTWTVAYGQAVVSFQNRVLLLGGVLDDPDESDWCSNVIWEMQRDGEWIKGQKAPWKPRRYLAACVDAHSDRLLVFGGENESGRVFDDSWAFDGISWSALPGVVPWQGVPDYAVGGGAGAIVIASNTVFEYTSSASEPWQCICRLPPKVVAVTSCAAIENTIYIATGDGSVFSASRTTNCEDWHCEVGTPDGDDPLYSLVCKGPGDVLYVYTETKEADGIGSVGTIEEALSAAITPRLGDARETMGLASFVYVWGGLGVLSCCGNFMHSA